MNRHLELTGDPIVLNLFPGGMDSPTFHQRRKVTFNVYLESESLWALAEHEDAAVRLGETLGRLLHERLKTQQDESPAGAGS